MIWSTVSVLKYAEPSPQRQMRRPELRRPLDNGLHQCSLIQGSRPCRLRYIRRDQSLRDPHELEDLLCTYFPRFFHLRLFRWMAQTMRVGIKGCQTRSRYCRKQRTVLPILSLRIRLGSGCGEECYIWIFLSFTFDKPCVDLERISSCVSIPIQRNDHAARDRYRG